MAIRYEEACEGVAVFYLGDGTHCSTVFALGTPDNYILIDSLTDPVVPELTEVMHAHGYKSGGGRALIVSHGHADHFGGACRLSRYADCPVWAHPGSAFVIEDPDDYFAGRGSICRSDRRDAKDQLRHMIGEPVRVERLLRDGDTVDCPGLGSLDVHHMPGHERGLITLFEKRARLAFTGDLVQAGFDSGDNWLGLVPDPERQQDSLARLKALDPAMLFKGHRRHRVGDDIAKDIESSRCRVAAVCEALLEEIREVGELTLSQAVRAAFRRVLHREERAAAPYAGVTVNGALCWLSRQGRIKLTHELTWRAWPGIEDG